MGPASAPGTQLQQRLARMLPEATGASTFCPGSHTALRRNDSLSSLILSMLILPCNIGRQKARELPDAASALSCLRNTRCCFNSADFFRMVYPYRSRHHAHTIQDLSRTTRYCADSGSTRWAKNLRRWHAKGICGSASDAIRRKVRAPPDLAWPRRTRRSHAKLPAPTCSSRVASSNPANAERRPVVPTRLRAQVCETPDGIHQKGDATHWTIPATLPSLSFSGTSIAVRHDIEALGSLLRFVE